MKSNKAYKIGVSKNPQKRLKDLKIGNCNIELIYESELMCNAYAVESILHKKFCNASIGSEWFYIDDEIKMLNSVQATINEIGIFNLSPNQSVNENDNKVDAFFYSLFEPTRKMIRQLDKEIEEIQGENKVLAQRLLDLGWTNEELNHLIEQATNSVMLSE